MKKNKPWQTLLIVGVLFLTIYNILPTLFFYTQPLSKPIDEKQAEQVAIEAFGRVNKLEEQSLQWLESYSKTLNIHPQSISIDPETPQIIEISFSQQRDAERLRQYLPRAGNLIPFYPAQLSLYDKMTPSTQEMSEAHKVYVLRKIPVHFDKTDLSSCCTFSKKFDDTGMPTETYQHIVTDRLEQVYRAVAGPSENAQLVALALQNREHARGRELLETIAHNIQMYQKTFGNHSAITQRFYHTFTHPDSALGPEETISSLINALENLKNQVREEKVSLKIAEEQKQKDDSFLDVEEKRRLTLLQKEEKTLLNAISTLKQHRSAFVKTIPFTPFSLLADHTTISTTAHNPIVQEIAVHWNDQTVFIKLQEDIVALKESTPAVERSAIHQIIYDEIAKISRESTENLTPWQGGYQITLNQLSDSQSFLKLDLYAIAEGQINQTKNLLRESWHPSASVLRSEQYPLLTWEEFQHLPKNERNFSLVLYSPSTETGSIPAGFRTNSIYLIAKNLGKLAQTFRQDPHSRQAREFHEDVQHLEQVMRNHGFVSYPGTTYPLSREYANDVIFEAEDFYLPVLQGTRENFTVHGTKRFATLEFSDLKQRILTLNTIETEIHEDLLKWRDEYNTSRVDPTEQLRFDVPKPTASPLWSNFALSVKKYFRGDERKILRWGLDMSGGKTVQVQLRDANNRPVTNDYDIRQGINELYQRVNKMGVSEVSLRQEGNNITLDFPGSQALSASDLVKASSMTFHIVNEKFSGQDHTPLSTTVHRFLQEVWNEAVVTNKKSIEHLQAIAWSHLYGDSMNPETIRPRTESAKILLEHGLRLANPDDSNMSNAFDDQISRIAMYKGESFSDWAQQTHPLLLVFNNYALEGSNLENVQGNYDPTKGNFLSFGIKSSYTLSNEEKTNPRNDLYAWTSVFAKENIAGTPYETFSKGKGWRMAVILNGRVVSAPTLDSALRDSAMISGHFTQREVNRLVADLKAGSLTFTPHILSEKNVSPELGTKERTQGIIATFIALAAVIIVMVSYYHFAGVIASAAVVINLLIIWAALQNIGATITLAGIAGIILTVGMAVDANVLVFERVREELIKTGKLSVAISMGYKKAYSAILDSNITTIIAALILLHFDAGPIKGFAVTLIIGIISSMFTALFMTRYFFNRWSQNPRHKTLSMSSFVHIKKVNFLKWGKLGITMSILLILMGSFFIGQNRHSIMGMDFTGGFATTIELEHLGDGHYREVVEKALVEEGANPQDIQVRELSPNNQLRIFLSTNMSLPGRPFYHMPIEESLDNPLYAYQENPRLVWLVNALQKGGVQLTLKSHTQLDQNWKVISGQMSDTMRNNAVLGLVIALAAILLYITLRFEFTYAISATIGLAFDVCITLALLAILHALGVPIQLDLNTVAALMTIVGYSLNDTIIVFDRIREDVQSNQNHSLKHIVNQSLNITFSRTILTSFTTFVVLLALVLFGGMSIFGFSLLMAVGVIVGTLSTFFIATTLFLYFQKKAEHGNHFVLNGATNG